MRKDVSAGMVLLSLCLIALLVIGTSRSPTVGEGMEVVTTTSLLGVIVERVGGDKVNVTTITAAAACPGEDDVKPSQIEATAKAKLFLMHGWPGEAFVEGLLESAENPDLRVEAIKLKGNWMTPPIQAQGVERVAAILGEIDPANKDRYQANARALLEAIQSVGGELKAKLKAGKTDEISVISMEQQAGFVKWAGFNLVGTYPRSVDLTPEKVKELMKKGREAGVALVIDNLQIGSEAGLQMAQEIGALQVTLSNFPGGLEGTETWEEAIERNVELLLEALTRYKES